MKKHILGFAIFSFIAGAAVLIGNLFFVPVYEMKGFPMKGFPVVTEQPQVSRKNSCFMSDYNKIENQKVKIEQAILDLKTRQFKTFMSVAPKNGENFTVALHFFVKDAGQTRYLATEKFSLTPTFNEPVSILLDWLGDSPSPENLYVVPERSNNWTDYKNNPPAFEVSKATPVLLSKGKGL